MGNPDRNQEVIDRIVKVIDSHRGAEKARSQNLNTKRSHIPSNLIFKPPLLEKTSAMTGIALPSDKTILSVNDKNGIAHARLLAEGVNPVMNHQHISIKKKGDVHVKLSPSKFIHAY